MNCLRRRRGTVYVSHQDALNDFVTNCKSALIVNVLLNRFCIRYCEQKLSICVDIEEHETKRNGEMTI